MISSRTTMVRRFLVGEREVVDTAEIEAPPERPSSCGQSIT
jgi:hypothetical protein